MKQAHIFIEGFVQGIGFRQFVKKEAVKRNIYGWVRNLPDGRVEALLAGDQKFVEQLIELCRKGPMLSAVDNVEVLWEDYDNHYTAFEISHDF